MSRWAPFLFSFLGRGICEITSVFNKTFERRSDPKRLVYIFVGTILLHEPTIRIIGGAVIAIIGLGYCVLEYIPSIEPPQNMRDANGEWGAEQI